MSEKVGEGPPRVPRVSGPPCRRHRSLWSCAKVFIILIYCFDLSPSGHRRSGCHRFKPRRTLSNVVMKLHNPVTRPPLLLRIAVFRLGTGGNWVGRPFEDLSPSVKYLQNVDLHIGNESRGMGGGYPRGYVIGK